jgi:hypothetical protein
MRRWATPGVWASLDRVALGQALAEDGTYRRVTIGAAAVYGARCRALVRATVRRTLREPARWLNAPFRSWMGAPLDPELVVATYTGAGGAPPLGAPPTAASCAGHVREPADR